MYKTILVPTELNHPELTVETLKKAAKLTENGRIILMHVLDRVPSYALLGVPEDQIPDPLPKATEVLNKMITQAGVSAEVDVRTSAESAYHIILAVAKDVKADLILINSHKPGGFQDYLLGSTAAKVVRHARCSVLVER